jgi:hypothetical protein
MRHTASHAFSNIRHEHICRAACPYGSCDGEPGSRTMVSQPTRISPPPLVCSGPAAKMLTSLNRLPHPTCWHWCGFSPVCVRTCTVNALLWIKLFPQPGVLQVYGRSFVCIL